MKQLKAAKTAYNALVRLHTILFESDTLSTIDADRLICATNDIGAIIIELEAINATDL